jgi:hypothetical protein
MQKPVPTRKTATDSGKNLEQRKKADPLGAGQTVVSNDPITRRRRKAISG